MAGKGLESGLNCIIDYSSSFYCSIYNRCFGLFIYLLIDYSLFLLLNIYNVVVPRDHQTSQRCRNDIPFLREITISKSRYSKWTEQKYRARKYLLSHCDEVKSAQF